MLGCCTARRASSALRTIRWMKCRATYLQPLEMKELPVADIISSERIISLGSARTRL
jgi:hypothetical protein